MTLSIEKFSPTKAELVSLANEYKNIVIKGVDDVAGFNIADEARKDLKSKRVEIQKIGKSLRAEALKFQKDVISLEKELISIIEPIEKDLKNQQEDIKKEKQRIERKSLIPARNAILLQIGVKVEETMLLDMDEKTFEEFYNQKNSEYLAEKERKLAEERLKLEREKEIEEAKKRVVREAEERLKREAEQEKQRKIKEKQEEERKQKEENERLRKNKEYKAWLKENNVENPNSDDVYIARDGDTFVLYKKVSQITIK